MATRCDALLVAQDDMAIVRRIGREEGQKDAIGALFMRPLGIESCDLGLCQGRRLRCSGGLKEAAHGRRQCDRG